MNPTLTEPVFLDIPYVSGPSGVLPLYRSALFGKDGSSGISPGAQPAIDGFWPPVADLPFGVGPFSEALGPPIFGLSAGAPVGTCASPGLESPCHPSQLGSWEQGSSADVLGAMPAGSAPGASMHLIRELAVAGARGLAGLFSAGTMFGKGGQWSPGAARARFPLPCAPLEKFLSTGQRPSPPPASIGGDSSLLPHLSLSPLARAALLTPETVGPFTALWQGAAHAARSMGRRASPSAFSTRTARGVAQRLVSQISRGWDVVRKILFARNGSDQGQGTSALAQPLGPCGRCGTSLHEADPGRPPFVDAPLIQGRGWALGGDGILRVGRVADGKGKAAKTIGEQILEGLKGMPGTESLAEEAGTTIVFAHGLWMAASECSANAGGVPGSLFGREEGGVAHPEADAGIWMAGGEPLRAMVGAARNLSDEEDNAGGENRGSGGDPSSSLVILLG